MLLDDIKQLLHALGEFDLLEISRYANRLQQEMCEQKRRAAIEECRQLIMKSGLRQEEIELMLRKPGRKPRDVPATNTKSVDDWIGSLSCSAKERIESFRARSGAIYRKPDGSEQWNGKGRRPEWLLRHLAAGGKPESLVDA